MSCWVSLLPVISVIFVFQYQSTRPFFIQVEMPTDAVKGEQLGIRIALFNYWNTALEVSYTTAHSSPPPLLNYGKEEKHPLHSRTEQNFFECTSN